MESSIDKLSNIWMLSFECASVRACGSVGQAVYNMSRELAAKGANVKVLMPSHGASKDTVVKKRLNLKEHELVVKGRLSQRKFLPYKQPWSFKIAIESGRIHGTEIILFKGLNKATSNILDDPVMYRPSKVEDKACLFARGVSGFLGYYLERNFSPPDIIHIHNYHAVPAGTKAKQILENNGFKVGTVFSVHDLYKTVISWPYLDRGWCDLRNMKHPVSLEGRIHEFSHKQILRKARRRMESFGAMESDILTAVSEDFLKHVAKFVGPLCEHKARVAWNGCDWNYESLWTEALANFGDAVKKMLNVPVVRRFQMRKYLLTSFLGNLAPDEPRFDCEEIAQEVSRLNKEPFLRNGRVTPFSGDGPMVLVKARIGKKSGLDMFFRAVPKILGLVPDVRFLLLLFPTSESLNVIRKFSKLSMRYKENVRTLFGRVDSIYRLAHLVSSIYVAPESERPFSIDVLEAMATGNPCVCYRFGGVQEQVVDIRDDLTSGTGILVSPGDPNELADAVVSLISIVSLSETLLRDGKIQRTELEEKTDKVSYSLARMLAIEDPSYGLTLRENAIQHIAKNFRWSKVVDMTIDCYRMALDTVTTLQGSG